MKCTVQFHTVYLAWLFILIQIVVFWVMILVKYCRWWIPLLCMNMPPSSSGLKFVRKVGVCLWDYTVSQCTRPQSERLLLGEPENWHVILIFIIMGMNSLTLRFVPSRALKLFLLPHLEWLWVLYQSPIESNCRSDNKCKYDTAYNKMSFVAVLLNGLYFMVGWLGCEVSSLRTSSSD